MALLAARGVECLWQWAAKHMPRRAEITAFCILAGLAVILIAHDTRRRVFLYPSDENNPYAYAHTTDDIARAVRGNRRSGGPERRTQAAHRGDRFGPLAAAVVSAPF